MLNGFVVLGELQTVEDDAVAGALTSKLDGILEELQLHHSAFSFGGSLGIDGRLPRKIIAMYFGPSDYFETNFRLFIEEMFEIVYAIEDGADKNDILAMMPEPKRVEYFANRGQEIINVYKTIVGEEILVARYVQIVSFVSLMALIAYCWLVVFRPMARRIGDAAIERENRAAILEETVATRTREIRLEQLRTSQLNELSMRMADESDFDKLVEKIIDAALDLANADGGTIYLPTSDNKLRFAFIIMRSIKMVLGGKVGWNIPFDQLPMFDPESGEPNHGNMATKAAHTGETSRVYSPGGGKNVSVGAHDFEELTEYRSESILTVSMRNRRGDFVGVLQLVNARNEDGEFVAFADDIVPFVESLASQAAVALELRTLVYQQRELIDSFVRVIATAIDSKSPYTGGHCMRIPVIARTLARKACGVDSGPFKDYAMTDEEWREFDIACLLHDCGKVTTPEFVVDKATKLEAIYNRIHEIRMRFEVLLRDARIEALEGALAAPLPDAAARALDEQYERFRDELAFIAECNIGGEFMAPEKIERLREIGGRAWTRHFDDRLGLSLAEMEHLETIPARPLPADEKLLGDKPEHVIPLDRETRIEWKSAFGFNQESPEHLFNYGELYNLSIERGTLTPEERFKINEHINQTIVMLESLPFPKHLRRVPEIAGGHHEKMDGTGYPRGLKGDEMSVSARIMAIADIFEALTAPDRPYKPAKKMSETISIMKRMAETDHIDSDLYALFIGSGAWSEYAELYLHPEQIDIADAADYRAERSV